MAKTTTSTSEDIVDFIDSASENLGEKGKDLWYEKMDEEPISLIMVETDQSEEPTARVASDYVRFNVYVRNKDYDEAYQKSWNIFNFLNETTATINGKGYAISAMRQPYQYERDKEKNFILNTVFKALVNQVQKGNRK